MSLNQHNDGSESLKNPERTEETSEHSPTITDLQIVESKKTHKHGEKRRVTFPEDDNKLVTGYMEPVNPWQAVGEISGVELIDEYKTSCLRHNTIPQQIILNQLKEYVFLGASRSGVLSLSAHPLLPAQCEALEAVLRRARFNRIEVCNAALNDETAVALFDMLEYYESASELDISCNTDFGILGWQAISRMINKSQYLEQLEARGTSLSENTAPVLGRGLRSPCALRVLHLQRAGLRGGPMLCLASALKQNKSVRELHIGDNNLLPDDASHLANLLRCNTFIQLLDISNNDIQDLGVERIANALSEQCTPSPSPSSSTSTSSSSTEDYTSSPQSANSASYQERGLAVLVMWNNNLTRNSGHHLSKALNLCKSLEVLNIGQNPLGGETINRVRVALQQNRTLLCLGIQGARLGPEAGVALAEVIEDNHYIQRIDLRDNKLQPAGLLALATALKKNYTLTRLDLDDATPSPNNGVDQPLEETRLVDEIRTMCRRNETQVNQQQSTPSTPTSEENLHRRRVASFSTRKISLTCQTLHRCYEPTIEPVLSPPKMPSGRLRSPLPSPIPSPASSPTPSPSHRSRFIVSRVSDSSSITSESSSPSTPPNARSFFPSSRFKVISVQEPPKINVTMAPEEVMIDKARENTTNNAIKSETDLNRNVCDDKIVSKEKDGTKIENMAENMGKKLPYVVASVASELQQHTEDVKKVDLSSVTVHPEHECSVSVPSGIKKNKSESSLDSPDLEVSRLMLKKETYDSSSSLDMSGSSMESLTNIQSNVNNNINMEAIVRNEDTAGNFKLHEETEDVFPINDFKNPFICSTGNESNHNRKKLSASSNESSLESSTFEAGVMVTFPHHMGHQSNLLNSSVSSNESVSPNIFGKHMKLHGSVTSLEASVSSLDSYKSKNDFISPQNPSAFTFPTFENSQLTESSDSGLPQSDINKTRTPSFNESFSSNEGTLTTSSNLKSSIFSMGGDSSLSIEEDNEKESMSGRQLNPEVVPRRVTSLLDVPSMQKSPRMRKISWVAPSNFNPMQQSSQPAQQQEKKDDDQLQASAASSTKVPSSLEKLLSLFHHPGSLFSRSDAVEKKSNDSSQSSSRRDSQTSMGSSSSFWPWNISGGSVAASTNKIDNKATAIGAIERLKKYGESFETALQFSNDNSEKKSDLHASKSDTYLENKDSENTLTNFNADRFRDALLIHARDSKNIVDFDIGRDSNTPACNSPPTYSVDSEYFNQTLTTCVIHPFQNPNVSTDYTVTVVNNVATECTCGLNQSIREIDDIVSELKCGINQKQSSFEECDVQAEGRETLGNENKELNESIVNSSRDHPEFVDSSTLDNYSNSGSVNVCNELILKTAAACEQSNVGTALTEDNRTVDAIENSNALGESHISSEKSKKCSNEALPESTLYEMGSVFKFHDVYKEYKDNSHFTRESELVESLTVVPNRADIVDSTKGGIGDDKNDVRVLSESERMNINEIVKNVCEEAVKSVAAKARRAYERRGDICDTIPSSNIKGSVIDINSPSINPISDDGVDGSDNVKDINVPIDDGLSKVQIDERVVCDNYSNLSSNQGCFCDFNNDSYINQCKYLDSRKCVGVNKSFNSDVDLNRQVSSDQDKSTTQILGNLPIHRCQIVNKECTSNLCDRIIHTNRSALCLSDSSLNSDNVQKENDSRGPKVMGNVLTDVFDVPSNVFNVKTSAQSTKNICDTTRQNLNDAVTTKVDSSIKDVKAMNTFVDGTSATKQKHDDLIISQIMIKDPNVKRELIRPTDLPVRTTPPKQISIVLKQSVDLGNKTSPNDRQQSPESGPSVSNLPSKIIKRIKENVSPENTLTSSMSNTKALAQELMERKMVLGSNTAIWEIGLKENVEKILEGKNLNEDNNSRYYDEILVESFNKLDEMIKISPKDQTSSDGNNYEDFDSCLSTKYDESSSLGDVDQGSDALTVKELISDEALTYVDDVIGLDSIVQSALDDDESVRDLSLPTDIGSIEMVEQSAQSKCKCDSEMAKDKVITEQDLLDRKINDNTITSRETNIQQLESIAIDVASQIIDESCQQIEESEKGDSLYEIKSSDFKPISILKKATPSISKTVSLPQNIPEATKPFPYYGFTLPAPKKSYDGSSSTSSSLPIRCGSLPENTSVLSGDETIDLTLIQSRRSTNSRSPVQNKLGKMARDSLFALNMSEDEIKDYRTSARLSSMDSVRSLGSLSENLEGLSSSSYVFQSSSEGESILEQGASQDSLVSLESISENASECDKENKQKTYDSI